MAFTQQEIEYYHDRGLMPDWAYYQQNGKSAQENYIAQTRKIKDAAMERIREQQQQEALEKYVTEMVEDKLEDTLEKVLDDLLKGFK